MSFSCHPLAKFSHSSDYLPGGIIYVSLIYDIYMCIYFYRFTYNHQKVRVDKGDFWDNFSVLCPNYTADAQNIRANTDLSLTVSVFCPSSGYSVMSHYSLWYTGLLLHSFISILTLKLFIHKLCHGTLETLLYSRQSMFPHLLGV